VVIHRNSTQVLKCKIFFNVSDMEGYRENAEEVNVNVIVKM
jgi:hypothetical protein